jgi:hypothetical protein
VAKPGRLPWPFHGEDFFQAAPLDAWAAFFF